MVQKRAKTKTVARRRPGRSVKKSPVVFAADSIGIAPEHLLCASPRSLPIAIAVPSAPLAYDSFMRQPLIPPRASFWLGVAFGILVIGILGYVAWKLYNVEISRALMVEFTRS